MLTEEYRRFRDLQKKHSLLYIFFIAVKYLFSKDLVFAISKLKLLIKFISHNTLNKINLDKQKYITEENLDFIFKKFNTDKGTNFYKKNQILQGHGFAKFYEKNFQDIKNNDLNILELGVLDGGSTASFFHFFKNAKLYCIDLNSREFKYKSNRINYFEINLRDKEKINNFVKDHLNFFDLVIDDASHLKSCILENLQNFIPSLKNQGFYIIEDYKYPEFYKAKNDIFDEINISDLLDSINRRKFIKSSIISNEILYKLFESKNVNLYKGLNKNSHIAFIEF